MAATWTIDSVQLVDREKRIVAVDATRTLDGRSVQYSVDSFRVSRTESPGAELGRLVGELEAISAADKTWGTPDLAELFPNAATTLKTKLDAMEVARG